MEEPSQLACSYLDYLGDQRGRCRETPTSQTVPESDDNGRLATSG
jgi:hypothetical protein